MSPRVIIVEDDIFIGIDLVEQLGDEGFDAIGPYVTVADALAEFEAGGCDVAVLDVNLGKGTSEGFAVALRAKGVPFVVLSGYSQEQRPLEFRNETSVTKPVHMPELVRTLNGLLSDAA